MKISYILLSIFMIAVGAVGYYVATDSDDTEPTITQQSTAADTTTAQNCVAEDCLRVDGLEYPVGTLEADVVEALGAALDDEYKAHATYEAVIEELGLIGPFSMIIRAEEKHISSLKALYDKYEIAIPLDPYTDVSVATSKAANCAVGVQAEIDNVALYRDQLLPTVADYPDISSTFTTLMNASQDNHLPAFEKCAP